MVDVDHDYDNRHLMIKHFEETYGKPKVSHIGTWAVLSVLSGIKDFARVLNVPFADANNLTKELQKIMDKPQAKFKDYDALKESSPDSYKIFQELEKKFPEVFRLTRKFEGCCRQYGVHASGVLVMPIDVNDMFPTRMDTKTGDIVTLYTGTELEAKSAIKQDILGLKSLTVIKNALKHIDSINNPGTHMTFEELYRRADVNDSKVYDMICAKNVNGVFQIESNMFKGLIDLIQPRNINDIAALVALGRPGPLTAGFDKQYAKGKNGGEKVYPIRGCEDILDDTYGALIYQEQCMLIAQKIANFNGAQADSLIRKAIG